MIDWDTALAGRTERMHASEIRELLKLLSRPEIISFGGGTPDPQLFPSNEIGRAMAGILASRADQALQYSPSEGYLPLREWIVGHMAKLGVACDADNIVITSGSQQGLDYLGKLLIGEGDTVLVTAPTYLGALTSFNPYLPRYDTLSFGNRTPTSYREAAGGANSRLSMAYVVTDFANPSGETLTETQRLHLLELATELNIPVIEDAAYTALRYEGEPVTSLLALDIARVGTIENSRVIYAGTFSKTLSPGLRIGWLCAASPLVRRVVLAKQAGDLHSPTLNQMAVTEVAAACHDEQIVKARKLYTSRRDAMLAALAASMPSSVTWSRPEGGMFIWVTLPEGFDGAELLAESIAKADVAFVPGRAFFADGSGRNTIRLSFAIQTEDRIREGIGRLGRLIAEKVL